MDIRIGRFEARYRLPQGLEGQAERLDRTLAGLFGAPLERALELAGVREDEELCIRHLDVPVRIHAGATDAAIETEWVLALARAFERARQTAEQQIASAADRDSAMFTQPAASAANAELTGSEEDFVTVVRYRSKHAALLDMAVRVARGDLSREWAWKQIGLWPAAASSLREAAHYLLDALLTEPRSIAAVLVTLTRFELLRELWLLLTTDAWVRLATAALSAAGFDAAATLAAVMQALRNERSDVREAIVGSQPWLAAAVSGARANRAGIEEAAASIVCVLALGADPTLRVLSLHTASSSTTAAKRAEAAGADVDKPREQALRIPGATRYGGLLFLLNLLERTGLVHAIRDDVALAGRSMRWTLHQLALKLVPVEHDDPAALAFAGLLPGDKAPSEAEARPEETETEALQTWSQHIAALTAELLKEAEFASDELALSFVCRRDAVVDGDPGWIVVTLPIETVSVELRRVGLDADPGWLPWLGAVVRFLYE